jgi:lycopene beta-cyclase
MPEKRKTTFNSNVSAGGQPHSTFDYIITGAGCAGLSLLMHGLEAGLFQHKKILLIDKDAKGTNDRTWCFWEKGEGLFQPIVKREWPALWFHSEGFSKKLDISPYKYKLIRGLDFYRYCFDEIEKHPNIHFLNAEVETLFSDAASGTGVVAGGNTYYGNKVFNSILFQKPILGKKHIWLLQHFKGWYIETATPLFDETVGTLMDFRTDQQHGATFFYVLPFSPTQALVEYTLFSKALLPDEAYEAALRNYISGTLRIDAYEVTEREFGIIPMTNHPFLPPQNNIIHMGTAGGYTKGSSGYTFRFIQKNAQALVAALAKEQPFSKPHAQKRFAFYDSVLLHVLHHQTMPGAAIFTDMFKKNRPQQVLKFLDNETSLPEDFAIINTLPTAPFLKAAIGQIVPFG